MPGKLEITKVNIRDLLGVFCRHLSSTFPCFRNSHLTANHSVLLVTNTSAISASNGNTFKRLCFLPLAAGLEVLRVWELLKGAESTPSGKNNQLRESKSYLVSQQNRLPVKFCVQSQTCSVSQRFRLIVSVLCASKIFHLHSFCCLFIRLTLRVIFFVLNLFLFSFDGVIRAAEFDLKTHKISTLLVNNDSWTSLMLIKSPKELHLCPHWHWFNSWHEFNSAIIRIIHIHGAAIYLH